MNGLPNLQEKLYTAAEKRIEIYPCHTNRASALGHDCERYLVYMRTEWDKALPHDVNLQLIFDEGNNQEKAVLQALAEAGVDVIEQQTSLHEKDLNITGHVDGVLNIKGTAVPLEIKSMSPHIWDSIFKRGAAVYEWEEVAEGFQTKFWLRKYYAQLQIYMLCKNNDKAILLCKNKTTGALAQVDIGLNYDYAEQLLQRAEIINRFVEAGELPDRIPFNNEVCRRCEYNHLCCPDEIAMDPYQTISDDQVAEWCKKDLEFAPAAKEKKAARDNLLKFVKANKDRRRWLVDGKYNLEYNGKRISLTEITETGQP
jgi:CRISPR/Cas system-associated exonuclease Cas4 (RecB family)